MWAVKGTFGGFHTTDCALRNVPSACRVFKAGVAEWNGSREKVVETVQSGLYADLAGLWLG
jgi:hypothetical protein